VIIALAAIVAALSIAAFAFRGDGLPTPDDPAPTSTSGGVQNVVPVISTTVVTTTLRPATTRPPATTASERTPKGKPKGKG